MAKLYGGAPNTCGGLSSTKKKERNKAVVVRVTLTGRKYLTSEGEWSDYPLEAQLFHPYEVTPDTTEHRSRGGPTTVKWHKPEQFPGCSIPCPGILKIERI